MRSAAAVVALIVCVHVGLWTLLQRQQAVPDFDGPLASISYSPYSRSQHPDLGDRPTAAQIRADLKLVAPYARAIRTYSSTGGVEQVPAVAAEFGLKVAVGIWIDKNEARNEREIQSAIDLARHHTNVTAIVVGNETILRGDKTFDQLIEGCSGRDFLEAIGAVRLALLDHKQQVSRHVLEEEQAIGAAGNSC